MIFELFIAFIFLALAFIVIGYYVDIKLLALLGFTTIFLLGLVTNTDGLTYKSGVTTSYSYMCSACVESRYTNSTGNTTTLASATETYNYTALNDNTTLWLGRWLMIFAVLGFTLVIISNRDNARGVNDR